MEKHNDDRSALLLKPGPHVWCVTAYLYTFLVSLKPGWIRFYIVDNVALIFANHHQDPPGTTSTLSGLWFDESYVLLIYALLDQLAAEKPSSTSGWDLRSSRCWLHGHCMLYLLPWSLCNYSLQPGLRKTTSAAKNSDLGWQTTLSAIAA